MKEQEIRDITQLILDNSLPGLQAEASWVPDYDKTQVVITDRAFTKFETTGLDVQMCNGNAALINLLESRISVALEQLAHHYVKRAAHILELIEGK